MVITLYKNEFDSNALKIFSLSSFSSIIDLIVFQHLYILLLYSSCLHHIGLNTYSELCHFIVDAYSIEHIFKYLLLSSSESP